MADVADVQTADTDFWVMRLCINMLGYATILVPGYLMIRYLRRIQYDKTAGPGFFKNLARLCVFGKEHEHPQNINGAASWKKGDGLSHSFCQLLFCFCGLQASYLVWGLLQERVMTFEYGTTSSGDGEYFKNSQFLVFVNRILSFVMGLFVLLIQKQPPHTAPLYKYFYSSVSNVMSSWFQYEALKYISFPAQVLGKASKVIPVMLMGKITSRKSYAYHEYATAGMISFGVGLFLLNSGDATRATDRATTISGVVMLVGYIIFDSFTSNWQGELFRQYKMSPVQMMAGVNMFSCLLTGVSLIEQGGFVECIAFMIKYPLFTVHALLTSLSSATGQIFIYYTIEKFGPVTFTIIMTVRQGFAILLSCVIYGHPLNMQGIFGVIIVFIAMFLRIYANKTRAVKAAREAAERNFSKV